MSETQFQRTQNLVSEAWGVPFGHDMTQLMSLHLSAQSMIILHPLSPMQALYSLVHPLAMAH